MLTWLIFAGPVTNEFLSSILMVLSSVHVYLYMALGGHFITNFTSSYDTAIMYIINVTCQIL